MQTGFARLAPFSGYKGIFLLSILILLLIAVLTAVDQFIKMTVITNLKPIGSVTCIPGLLEFRYLENNGAAFGFFAGLSWLLIILTIGLMAALLVFLFRYKHHTWMSRTSCVLIIAGGIGNLIDRFIFGYVVDYIHVLLFPFQAILSDVVECLPLDKIETLQKRFIFVEYNLDFIGRWSY